MGERDDAFDGGGGFERDVEEDELRLAASKRDTHPLAVGEFLGVDAGAVQDQRQEVPDAGVGVDDEAERRTRFVAARLCGRGDGG